MKGAIAHLIGRGSSSHSPERLLDVWIESIAGACLFGIPLTYTMETWWIGQRIGPWWTFAFYAIAIISCVLLAVLAAHDTDQPDRVPIARRVVASVASTTLLAFALLLLVGQISLNDPWHMVSGMVVVQLIPLSIGASIAGIVFTGGGDNGESTKAEPSKHPIRTSLMQSIGVPAAGALFMAISVAPTQEIPMIAASLNPVRVVAMAIAGVVIGWVIVHASGFAPDHATRGENAVDRRIALLQTLAATAVALLVAFMLLVAFGQIGFDDAINLMLTETLVLGIPAIIGAAAGRIVL